MYSEQEQIIAITSVIKKLKDDNLKLANNFMSAPPGKVKGNGGFKGKVNGQKQTDKRA